MGKLLQALGSVGTLALSSLGISLSDDNERYTEADATELNKALVDVGAKTDAVTFEVIVLDVWQTLHTAAQGTEKKNFEAVQTAVFKDVNTPSFDALFVFRSAVDAFRHSFLDAEALNRAYNVTSEMDGAVLQHLSRRALLDVVMCSDTWTQYKDVVKALVADIQSTPAEVRDAGEKINYNNLFFVEGATE